MSDLPPPSPHVVHRRIDDDVVLVNLRTNEIHALNETGARIWELLVEGRSRAAIESALLEEYDVPPTELASEMDTLLHRLREVGAVEAS